MPDSPVPQLSTHRGCELFDTVPFATPAFAREPGAGVDAHPPGPATPAARPQTVRPARAFARRSQSGERPARGIPGPRAARRECPVTPVRSAPATGVARFASNSPGPNSTRRPVLPSAGPGRCRRASVRRPAVRPGPSAVRSGPAGRRRDPPPTRPVGEPEHEAASEYVVTPSFPGYRASAVAGAEERAIPRRHRFRVDPAARRARYPGDPPGGRGNQDLCETRGRSNDAAGSIRRHGRKCGRCVFNFGGSRTAPGAGSGANAPVPGRVDSVANRNFVERHSAECGSSGAKGIRTTIPWNVSRFSGCRWFRHVTMCLFTAVSLFREISWAEHASWRRARPGC